MRIFCNAKDSHIFSTKKYQRICNIYVLNFNETSTNDVVNFEQLAPGYHLERKLADVPKLQNHQPYQPSK